MPRRLTLSTLFFALLTLTAKGAELYLNNGDKISGEVLRQENGNVILRHPLLGELSVPEAEISKIQDSPKDALAKGTPAAGKTPAGVKKSSNKNGSDELDDDERIASTWLRGWKRITADTKGAIELGYHDQQGRKNTTNLSFRANAEYTNQPNNYRFDWRYYFGEYNDSVETDKKDWTFRWRRDLNKRFFTQTITNYATDRVKHIDLNLEQSAGVGYAALNTNRQKFNVGAGLVAQHRIISGQDTGVIALGEFFEDYTRKITGRVSIKQAAQIQYSPVHRASYTTINNQLVRSNADAGNYRYNWNMAVVGKLTQTISMNMRFEYEFDNTVFESDLKADRRISSTIGYMF